MATLAEKALGKLDKIAHRILDIACVRREVQNEDVAYEEIYWFDRGEKFAIVGSDGDIRLLGNTGSICHRYDKDGELLSRKRMVLSAMPEERVVYGTEAANCACCRHHHISNK